jgi:Zn finger protein HypA/HybF involved in hydrogenase expression
MPQNFMECDDCDRIFSKFAVGSKNLLAEHRKLRIECPFCQSEEIDSLRPELKTGA